MAVEKPILDRPALLALRWGGTAIIALVLGAGLGGWLPSSGLLMSAAVLLIAAGLNGLLHRDRREGTIALVLLGDTAVLTVLLASSGGASNPFTLLYLLPVFLAALMLRPSWTAAIALGTTACFAGLLLTGSHQHHMNMSQHLVGMLVAYGATVPVVAAAVHRFRTATAAAEAEASRARASLVRSQRLASLAALAGGAAHELSTPLSTILLIASELKPEVGVEARSELAAIEVEVGICRSILDQLAVELGVGHGEAADAVDLLAFTREAVEREAVEIHAAPQIVVLPTRLVAQALRRLVGNARDASGPSGTVRLVASVVDDQVSFEVSDVGVGMSPEVLSRACEPFFTTKSGGEEGRGLGLFFVYSLAQQLGGSFTLVSSTGQGTTATLLLPSGVP